MILVDIYIPSMDKTYDFQVDEGAAVDNLIMEIAEMIGTITKSGKNIHAEKLMLCSMDQKTLLQRNSSLRTYGIKNGSKLMLV